MEKFAYGTMMVDIAANSFSDLIEIVRQGYKIAAVPYHEQKDTSILSLPIYHHWLALVPDGVAAELGCGSGFPVAHHIASQWRNTGKKFLGIDLSEEQIDIAKQSLMKEAETVSFTVREMMDWCKKQKDNSISGIIALFSIFHLPRNQHAELFTHIERILKDSAPLLFTCPEKSHEGFEQQWLGASKMFWSSFSYGWYEVTLEDIGFDFISKSKETKNFNSQKETTYYLLYQKRLKRKSINQRELFLSQLRQQHTLQPSGAPQTPQAGPMSPLAPFSPSITFSTSSEMILNDLTNFTNPNL
eukprot:TRINITY_DN10898_c0_g1_i1.p1 TRINITY_DN10898_c0_g1~~TRINITY_DN10898_c0_g1_i1.p1  ORF type:complete len:320 (-),score=36.97 TRINITY_DN10898_c0_g1_i1:11-913(-)